MSDLIKPLTVAEIERLEARTGRHYELVKGELQAKAMASPEHSKIVAVLMRRIGVFVEDHQLGETYESSCSYLVCGTPENPELIYMPDFSFVQKDHVQKIYRGFYQLAPDLAVEVISHSERAGERDKKVKDYLEFGARQVWQIYPEKRQVIIHLPDGTSTTYNENDVIPGGDVLPNLELKASSLW